MATIKQRFEKLGLAWSTPVLSEVGRRVANRLYNNGYRDNIKQVMQMGGTNMYHVNDYPVDLLPEVDKMIIMVLNEQNYLMINPRNV